MPILFVEIVIGKVDRNEQIYNIFSRPSFLSQLKVNYFQLYLFAGVTRKEVEAKATAVRLYLTIKYMAVAIKAEFWMQEREPINGSNEYAFFILYWLLDKKYQFY